VTGPAPITHADIAAALTSALGRDITFVDVPSEAFAESLQGILPPWQIQGLLEDYAHYRRGEAASVPRGRRDHRQAPSRRHAFRPRLRPGVRRLETGGRRARANEATI
jgi:uncharacterized protein YbjT (DUF2867 family)